MTPTELEVAAKAQVLSDLETVNVDKAQRRTGRNAAILQKLGWWIVLDKAGSPPLVPVFQLEPEHRETVCRINQTLDAGRFPWSAASWWSTPNVNVEGYPTPVDLLAAGEIELLWKLAHASVEVDL